MENDKEVALTFTIAPVLVVVLIGVAAWVVNKIILSLFQEWHIVLSTNVVLTIAFTATMILVLIAGDIIKRIVTQ